MYILNVLQQEAFRLSTQPRCQKQKSEVGCALHVVVWGKCKDRTFFQYYFFLPSKCNSWRNINLSVGSLCRGLHLCYFILGQIMADPDSLGSSVYVQMRYIYKALQTLEPAHSSLVPQNTMFMCQKVIYLCLFHYIKELKLLRKYTYEEKVKITEKIMKRNTEGIGQEN